MKRNINVTVRLSGLASVLFLGGSLSLPLSCRQKSVDPPAGAEVTPAQTSPAGTPQSASAAPPSAAPTPLNAAQPNADNPGVVDIPDVTPYSQVVAVSDNHGMLKNLKRLLKTAHLIDADDKWTGGNTLLLVVGDMIDKGPKSLEVVDLWMGLSAQAPASGGRVVTLLGNHEAEFLADPENSKAAPLRDELEDQNLPLTTMTAPTQPRGRFLRQMPLAARVGGKWLFCHAGWPPSLPWNDFVAKAKSILKNGDYANPLLSAPDSILERRAGSGGSGKWWDHSEDVAELEARLTTDGLTGVVFGHQPEAFGLSGTVGPYSPTDHRLVKIDSGMAPDAGAHPGCLLVFPKPQELTQNSPPAHMISLATAEEK